MNYIVVIADVVASRNIADRALIQDQFVATLSRLNDRNLQLVSPYTVTLGDEFQGRTLLSALVAILVSLLIRALVS